MGGDDAVAIEVERVGKAGRARLTVRFPDGSTFTDKLDVTVAAERDRFATRVCRGRKGIARKAVRDRLEEIAASVVGSAAEDSAGSGEKGGERLSQADRLVQLVEGIELFHGPGSDPTAYAVVTVGDHRETWPVASNGFRRWLARRYYGEFGKAPGSQAVQDALGVLTGRAQFDGPERPVAVRLAEAGGFIWIDLADDGWRAVRVGPDGWEVDRDPPVRFVRRRGMLPLPEPTRGGRVDDLRPLVNLPDDSQWVLFVACLVAALRPGRPFPILAINGEQGSAKSSLSRAFRALTDPNEAPLRRPPRDERDLMIAASNGWVVGYDNLSGLSHHLSDALCCLSTGGGFGTRELYSDDGEKLFNVMRPVVVNGIEDLVTRPDLLDRAVRLTLPVIPDDARQDEDRLRAEFDRVRPGVLGALLDAVSRALRELPGVRLPAKPRMADFARWVVAAEPALGWRAGSFMEAYTNNREDANSLAMEASPVGTAVESFMADRDRWSGTAMELLTLLNEAVDEATRKQREWPASPRGLSGQIRRLAPNLRRAGVECRFLERAPGGQRRRVLELERVAPGGHRATAGDGRDGRDGAPGDRSPDPAEEVVEWTG